MTEINLDKSRLVRLKARINEESVPRVLTFRQGGSPYDISGLAFKLFVFKRQNSTQKLFTLSVGDGLSIGGSDNELTIEISEARATQSAGTYFWRLWSQTENHTWLNGPFEFHEGESDNVEEEEEIYIYQNG